jgi:hypothetical protein
MLLFIYFIIRYYSLLLIIFKYFYFLHLYKTYGKFNLLARC